MNLMSDKVIKIVAIVMLVATVLGFVSSLFFL
ncbi:MAG: DUF4044 domain-containing protein [Bacilli bacterium]|nr:DUF4044 domain-containing protein [Bacilli bacterium]